MSFVEDIESYKLQYVSTIVNWEANSLIDIDIIIVPTSVISCCNKTHTGLKVGTTWRLPWNTDH